MNALAITKEIQQRKIVVTDRQESVFLKVDDIVCAEANGAYTNVFLSNGKSYMVCKNLKTFSEKLPHEDFYRVHKSYVINVNSIAKYIKSDGGYLVLDNGMNVPVSVRKREGFTKMMEEVVL